MKKIILTLILTLTLFTAVACSTTTKTTQAGPGSTADQQENPQSSPMKNTTNSQ